MDEIEFNIGFTDITLCETNGVYLAVKAIMDTEYPRSDTWMLRSAVTIDSPYGMSSFMLHFYYDGKIRIISYNPGSSNVLYNPDMNVLSVWSEENGWKTPEPSDDLINEDLVFWKENWEMRLIDSESLDNRFGEREIYIEDDEDEENSGYGD